MNPLTRAIFTGCLSLGTLALSLHAQDAASNAASDNQWKQCLIILEAYSMDKADGQSILDTERGSNARYRRVLDLNRAGKARLETLTAVTTKSGMRTVVEGIDEVRYATEFNPPEVRNGLARPTAWETRNAGDTLEVEPIIDADGRTCHLNLAPKVVTLLGFKDVAGMANDTLIGQPTFHAQKITTSITTLDGEISYLGTMTPPTTQGISNGDGASDVWLAFIRVHVSGPTADELKPRPGPISSNVTLQYSCYSLDRAEAREILAGATTLTAPWEKLQAALSARRARFEHLSTIIGKSGQRSVSEEIQEVRFASDFAPDGRRGSTETTRRTVTIRPDSKKADEESDTTEETTVKRTDANSERQPGFATTFETRNTGVTVEVELVVGPDGVTVDLNHVIGSVAHRGDLQTTGIAARYPPQPLFEWRKVTSTQSVVFGRNIFVGTLNPPGNDGVNGRTDTGRTWLLFLRAENER